MGAVAARKRNATRIIHFIWGTRPRPEVTKQVRLATRKRVLRGLSIDSIFGGGVGVKKCNAYADKERFELSRSRLGGHCRVPPKSINWSSPVAY